MSHAGENLKNGERRQVTVLFCDMANSTSLSETLDPEEMDGLMSSVFSRFEHIVKAHEGTVEKYIGDAMVAVFGVPAIHEDDPQRAINTALQLQEEATAINGEFARRSLSLQFRMGIHTGLITTGRRGEYDVVTGHAMNVAARLEEAADVEEILVSGTTRLRAEQDFVYGTLRPVGIRGTSESVHASPVLGREANPVFSEGEFVGHEKLVARAVRSVLTHVPDETSGLLFTGPAGIGKTRVAGRVIEQLHRLPDFASPVLTARAHMYRSIHFSVIVDLILTYFDREPNATRQELARAVRGHLAVAEDTARRFADIAHDPAPAVGENEAMTVLFGLLTAIVEKHRSSPYPVLIVIDNYQFLDPQSRDLLSFFLKHTPEKPFFILTARETSVGGPEELSAIPEVEVPPLSTERSEILFRRLWPECESEATIRTIVRNSAGNPLFLREYVRYAKESGGSERIPNTIQNIILSSIDKYGEARRDLLKKVSAFKQSFTRDDARFVEARTEGEPDAVEASLQAFLSDGVLVENNGALSFRHDVFKHTLYDSLLNHNKKVLHGVIAERMRQQEQPHTERLLHHLSRADMLEELISTLESAHDAFLNPDYVPYIDLLLEHPQVLGESRKLEFLFRKAAVLFNSGNHSESDRIIKEMLDISMNTHDVEYAAAAFHMMMGHHLERFEFQKATLCGERALAHYLRQDGSRRAHANNVRYILSIAASLGSESERAEKLLAEIADESEDSALTAAVARSRSDFLFGRYRSAFEHVRPIIEDSGDRYPERYTALFPGMMALWQLCDYRRMRDLLDELERHQTYQAAHTSQVFAARAVADYILEATAAETSLQRAEFYMLQIRNDFGQLDALRTLAIASIMTGQDDRAERFARAGTGIGLRHSAYYPGFSCLMVMSELLWRRGDSHGSDFFLREAESFASQDFALPFRDLIVYHYFQGVRSDTTAVGEQHLARAAELLEHEYREIADPARFETLLGMRSFGTIYRALQEQGLLPEQLLGFEHSKRELDNLPREG